MAGKNSGKTSSPLKLNLGCGRYKKPGWVDVDDDKNVNPDVLANVINLPYPNESVDEIYAGHLLEHFDWHQGQAALRYWRMLLKPGGKIYIVVPDFKSWIKVYLKNPDLLREINEAFLYSSNQKSEHRYCYDALLLKNSIERVGFRELKPIPKDFHLLSVRNVKNQVGFEAIK